MHINYTPEPIDFWVRFYKLSIEEQPQYQLGGDLPGYRAYRPLLLQHGAGLGSFFKSLYRWALPLLKSAGKHALTAGSHIASDVAAGQPLTDSVKKHARQATGELLKETGEKVMKGKGVGKRPRQRKMLKALKRKRTSISAPFIKRKFSGLNDALHKE